MARTRVTMLRFVLMIALSRPTVTLQWPAVFGNMSMSAFENPDRCTEQELQSKDLDVVLFGATGSLGGIFAEYLATKPDMPSWALVGREMASLTSLKQKLMSVEQQRRGAQKAKLIEADYSYKSQLKELTKRAKVVLNTAGPFEENGAAYLIEASIENCAHYVDVAGETHWRADMLKKFGQKAEQRGLIMTQGAGYVSLAADWLALSAVRGVAQDGNGPPNDVFIVFTRMNGAPGGGSLASAQNAWEKYGPITDPYILSPETPEAARVDREIDGVDQFGFHKGVDMQLAVYAGARMDCPVARRSMQLEFPGVPIKVHEAQQPELMNDLKTFLMDPRMVNQHPPMMPGTHTGLPNWMLDEGSFAAEAWSVRKKDGRAYRVKISGTGDPAFRGSARMTGELAISLALNGPYKGKVGYLSPAQVVDTADLERRWKTVDNGSWVTVSHKVEKADSSRKPAHSGASDSSPAPSSSDDSANSAIPSHSAGSAGSTFDLGSGAA